jgi:peptide/nickel transport system permease protein
VISIPVLFGITVGIFLIANLAPGDPVSALIDPNEGAMMGEEWMEQRRSDLGLDQPLPVRYVTWLGELLRGNLGYSLVDRSPVSERIAERVWPTLKLMLAAQFVAILTGIPLGIVSALKHYSKLDYGVTLFAFSAVSVPNFFLGLCAIYVFAVLLGWLPTTGMGPVDRSATLIDSLRYLVLPAFVLGLSQAAALIRYTRSGMLETLGQDYIRSARSKGLRERVVVTRHALRNAMIPIVTVLALNLPILLGGTVIIEAIFAWPGMGTLLIRAVRAHDYPVIMAVNLIIAIAILVSNLVADVLYAVVDPRIRYS